MDFIEAICDQDNLHQARKWLHSRRKNSHYNNDYCQQRQLKYLRFMDDWVVLCNTRNQLRTVVRLMNGELDKVRMTKHPFKTYIGRIKDSGFDFLSYRIADKAVKGLAVAWSSWVKHQAKLKQLYEQNVPTQVIAEYVRRWRIWVRSGVTLNFSQLNKSRVDFHATRG